MASKILNVRMDEQLHAEFKAFCESVHIPASTLMAAFAAQTVRMGRVPFEIGSALQPSEGSTGQLAVQPAAQPVARIKESQEQASERPQNPPTNKRSRKQAAAQDGPDVMKVLEALKPLEQATRATQAATVHDRPDKTS